jgi:CheY-like chemotaxis protein
MKILYLENHAVFADQVIRQFLKAYRVSVVPSLAAARNSLSSGEYDLVLSDYDLDDGKGDEFVRECRAMLPNVPIIAVSSHEAGNAALMNAGASTVCSKMEFDHIEQVIQKLFLDLGSGVPGTRSPTHPEFGIFDPVFESPHGYLALLGLHSADAALAVEEVRTCCRKVPDPYPDICRLLADRNWRPHLVAAVAVIVSGFQAAAVKQLWYQLDSGSWVTPQIATALFLVDPDFATQAHIRLKAGCPVDPDQPPMDPLERHSATGPAGTVERSAKCAAALLHLASMLTPVPNWVREAQASADIQILLAQDVDNASGIVNSWLGRIKAIIGPIP